MILTVDIGNTHTVFGVYNDDKLICKFRIQSIHNKTTDEYATILLTLLERNNLTVDKINGAIISSVVPQLLYTFDRVLKKYFKITPFIVNDTLNTGITLKIDNPKELGADRIANAVAGIKKFGSPCIIIDFGTATTFDVIDKNCNYIGGIICPGIMTISKTLRSSTAQLPEVSVSKTPSVIGKNTIHQIQSGIYFGYLEMINGLLGRIINEEFHNDDVKIIVTGGLGSDITNDMDKKGVYEPNLTLDGLYMLYRRNI